MTAARFFPIALITAGLANIVGVLVFTLGLTNFAAAEPAPDVFGAFGCVVIMLWGAAYIAAARAWERVPWLMLVFALEKLLYVVFWSMNVGDAVRTFETRIPTEPLGATFHLLYGVSDGAFVIVFACAFVAALRARKRTAREENA